MKISVLNSETSYQFFQKKDAPTIILVHGWLQNWESWSPVIKDLSKTYQLLIPDLPGFGKSTLSQVWSPETYGLWLATFLTHPKLNLKRDLYLCGHSFGGKICALTVALHGLILAPKIKGLILVDSSGLPDPLSVQAQIQQAILALVPTFAKMAIPKSFKHKTLAKIGSGTDHLQSNPLQKEILKKTVRHSIKEYLPKIDFPSLIVWGKNDKITPIHQAKAMHVALPKSKLVVMEHSGHFPFCDEPKKFTSVVSDFIQNP
jgi:pimeloyl-ACP methyl ester carboxylesterase